MAVFSPVTAAEILYKTPGESILYSMEFADLLESGETLSSGEDCTEVDTTDLTITSKSISGTKVRARVAGGSVPADPENGHETEYKLLFSVVTSANNTRQMYGRLVVADQ